MELRSGRFIASGEARRRIELGDLTPSGPDHIGALPDDLLLLVLARLSCITTAARTSVLACRWRGLWTHLPALVLRDIPSRSIWAVFDALHASSSTPSAAGEVTLLDVLVADEPNSTKTVTALLRTAAWFMPEHLSVAVPLGVGYMRQPVDLPCFDLTTTLSLSMGSYPVELQVPPAPVTAAECLFPVLTTVVLSGYYTTDGLGLAALVAHSPCLRVLRYFVDDLGPDGQPDAITVHSLLLRELVVEVKNDVHHIDIATPMLKKLTMSYYAHHDLTVSVVAPMVEEVLWRCRYWHLFCLGWYTACGCWELVTVILMSAAMTRPPSPPLLHIDARTGQIFLRSSEQFDGYPRDYLEQQVEKHMVAADLSVVDLELLLTPLGHVYGALVVYLLGMRRVRTALRRLKLALLIPEYRCREEKGCHERCYCELTDWRSQTICLPRLEQVEIDGFQGHDHEFDFLELVFRCAPMLRRMTVKQSNEVASSSDAKILSVFKMHPSVECYVLSSDSSSSALVARRGKNLLFLSTPKPMFYDERSMLPHHEQHIGKDCLQYYGME